jgi:hypothetical protein
MQIAMLSLAAFAAAASTSLPAPPAAPLSLEGTWVMDTAFETLADGTRATIYGPHPAGLMMIDREGRYTLQIFRRDRPRFASGDKTRGTDAEYREAVLGSSTHFGRVRIDAARRQLVFEVEAASWPNWEGRQQVRDYRFEGGLLSYQVPASASGNGTVATSIWRKVGP